MSISGGLLPVESESEVVGVGAKRDLTDQEGVARRVSRSCSLLILLGGGGLWEEEEERGRGIPGGGRLVMRMRWVLRRCWRSMAKDWGGVSDSKMF